MNINLKESKRLLRWFDIAVECDSLSDADLKLYDKIRENVEDEVDANDPLLYNPGKKSKSNYTYSEEEEESRYDMDEYSTDEKY